MAVTDAHHADENMKCFLYRSDDPHTILPKAVFADTLEEADEYVRQFLMRLFCDSGVVDKIWEKEAPVLVCVCDPSQEGVPPIAARWCCHALR